MFGASGCGCEALKNLILPGVGKVVIIDDKKVTEEDIASNFFVTTESLGKNRDEETSKYLLELNSDVSGSYSAGLGPEESFKEYSLIIATQLDQETKQKVAAACQRQNVPIIFLNTYG